MDKPTERDREASYYRSEGKARNEWPETLLVFAISKGAFPIAFPWRANETILLPPGRA